MWSDFADLDQRAAATSSRHLYTYKVDRVQDLFQPAACADDCYLMDLSQLVNPE